MRAVQVQTVIVDSMQERKTEMAKLSSGFVVLPGGYGTWEEVCTVALLSSSPTY
jgi:predicted Rossmann-fold nucleotide-binding protein